MFKVIVIIILHCNVIDPMSGSHDILYTVTEIMNHVSGQWPSPKGQEFFECHVHVRENLKKLR